MEEVIEVDHLTHTDFAHINAIDTHGIEQWSIHDSIPSGSCVERKCISSCVLIADNTTTRIGVGIVWIDLAKADNGGEKESEE